MDMINRLRISIKLVNDPIIKDLKKILSPYLSDKLLRIPINLETRLAEDLKLAPCLVGQVFSDIESFYGIQLDLPAHNHSLTIKELKKVIGNKSVKPEAINQLQALGHFYNT